MAGSARTDACPICARPMRARWRPFCSKRCADLDLGRWLAGDYAIASEEADSVPEPGHGSGDEPGSPER